MNYLLLLLTVPLTLFAVAFAVSNAQDVTVMLLPFEGELKVPLAVLTLGMMGAGFFFGAFFVWMHGHRVRLSNWKNARRADRLEKELTVLQQKTPPV